MVPNSVTSGADAARQPMLNTQRHEHRPKAVLLDCGNTILNANPQAIRRVLASHGHGDWAASLTDVLGLVADLHAIDLPNSKGKESFYLWWRRLSGIPDALDDDLLRAVTLEPDLYTVLDPTVLPALERVKAQGLHVAVVANAEGQTATEMTAFGLSHVVDVVVDSSDVDCRKPHVGIYAEAGRRLGLDLSECWFVGDALFNDVLGPLRAGMGRAFLYDPTDRFARVPVERVDSMTTLADLVASCG